MANSYVDFQRRCVRLPDRDIELVRFFLSRAAGSVSGPLNITVDFEAFLASWKYHGPGLYDIILDRFVISVPERREYLAVCLETARKFVSNFGNEIPLECLRAAFRSSDSVVDFGGYPSQRVTNALAQLEALVSGNATSTEQAAAPDRGGE